ncbi:MAG: hypothetical protein ACI8Z5_001150 [Lentimonas sp.]|jgi:hypothetical protein
MVLRSMTAMVIVAAGFSSARLYEGVRIWSCGGDYCCPLYWLPSSEFQAPKRRDECPTEYCLALLVESAPILLAVFVLFIAFVSADSGGG